MLLRKLRTASAGQPALLSGVSKSCGSGGKPLPLPRSVNQGPTTSQGAGHARRNLVWHLRLLGILWIIFAVLRLVPAVSLMSFNRIGIPFIPWPVQGWLHPVLAPLGFLVSALAPGRTDRRLGNTSTRTLGAHAHLDCRSYRAYSPTLRHGARNLHALGAAGL